MTLGAQCYQPEELYGQTFCDGRVARPLNGLTDWFYSKSKPISHLSGSTANGPSESVLPIRLRLDFWVVFGSYAGEAVNRVGWHEG